MSTACGIQHNCSGRGARRCREAMRFISIALDAWLQCNEAKMRELGMTDGDRADSDMCGQEEAMEGYSTSTLRCIQSPHIWATITCWKLSWGLQKLLPSYFSVSPHFSHFVFQFTFFRTDSTCVIFAPFIFCGLYSIVCIVFKYFATSWRRLRQVDFHVGSKVSTVL